MELKQIKHHISSDVFIIVTEDGWQVFEQRDTATIGYITTINNTSITRLIALQSILKDQEI